MDLAMISVGILLFLITPSLQSFEGYSVRKKREVLFPPGTKYDEDVEPVEVMRKRMQLLPENALLQRIFSTADDDSDLLTNIRKRQAEPYQDANEVANEFIEEKLIEQGQALEQLVKMVLRNEELTERLVENLSKQVEQPLAPEKIDAPRTNNRRSNVDDKQNGNTGSINKDVSKYGSLIKNLLISQTRKSNDPIPVLEVGNNKQEPGLSNRRSFNQTSRVQNQSKDKEGGRVLWCQDAVVCNKTGDPLCGYDETFGYAKFNNLCHLLKVNCYYKYNFTMVACEINV